MHPYPHIYTVQASSAPEGDVPVSSAGLPELMKILIEYCPLPPARITSLQGYLDGTVNLLDV
jgi:hypothetical protein